MGRYAHTGSLRRLRPRDREVVDAVLDRLDIGALARRHLGELSGGQRQRVLVAQGLAQEGSAQEGATSRSRRTMSAMP